MSKDPGVVTPGDEWFADPRVACLRAPVDAYGGVASTGLLPPMQQVPDGKRPRWEAEATVPAPPGFEEMVKDLDNATVRAILIALATARGSPSAQAAVRQAYHKLAEIPPIDFDHHSKEVWKVLNYSQYTKLSSRSQYDAAGDACDEIDEYIQDIDDRTKSNSHLETKGSALKTITKIMETILCAKGTLGNEVRRGGWEVMAPDVMRRSWRA
ncbi:hypothetical protein SLS62_001822 [Diatrype stigma]|uniref:Uncharacterized protein n=1 Tax=Diatrype stigma TaxID=117547 RepID=A0AAN9YRG3_9PEZI